MIWSLAALLRLGNGFVVSVVLVFVGVVCFGVLLGWVLAVSFAEGDGQVRVVVTVLNTKQDCSVVQ
ncbi:MAG: hypothetical protein ACRDAX_03525 [Propionibacteriaceae bacterium]